MNPQSCCAVAAALVLSLSACSGTTAIISPGAPSGAVFTAALTPAPAPTPPTPATTTQYICFGGASFVHTFGVSMTAFQPLDLDRVTIRLLSGESLGPTITFPSSQLASNFGNLRLAAGTTRIFTFSPQFTCGPQPPQSIGVEIVVIGLDGFSHSLNLFGPVA